MSADRAELRLSAALLLTPLVPALAALERSLTALELIVATGHPNRHAVNERFGNQPPGSLNNASEGGARHTHSLSGIFMIQPHQIRQAQRLHFVHCQPGLFQVF
jgi:hypothetical protein